MRRSNAEGEGQTGIRAVTRDLYRAIFEDEWPSRATEIDFGIASPAHFGALQYAVKCDGVTLEQLDDALGSSVRIQALIGTTNPYRDAIFTTTWDELPEEPDTF